VPFRNRSLPVVDLAHPFLSKPAKKRILPHRKYSKISEAQPVNMGFTDIAELFPRDGREQKVDRIFSKIVDRRE